MSRLPAAGLALVLILSVSLGLPLPGLAQGEPTGAPTEEIVFGTLPIAKPTKLLAQYRGLVEYYERVLGQPIRFEVGKDYPDAIAKFQSGYYDFGYIGPAPYVIATRTSPLGTDNFRLIAALETAGKPYFHAAIIAGIDNTAIQSLSDLAGKRFAFGSRLSTLSCYLPADMLIQAGALEQLASFDFVGKHDAVANAVHLGRYDAGAIKEGVHGQFADKVKVIAKSEPVWDFLILAHKDMDTALFERIKEATLSLKDPAVLKPIKPEVTGFVPTEDGNYDNLREIIQRVDARLGAPEL